jgi:ribosomal protein S18 acetylase RimI-like enzyme
LPEEEFLQFWEIYQRSFPPDEKRAESEQRKLLSNKQYKLLRFYNRPHTQVIGFLALWEMEEFTFLEHFAIREEYRGKGLGGRFLTEFQSQCDKDLILEVELPNTPIAKRRVEFYERAGFCYNHYPYLQPPYDENGHAVELSLMSYPTALSKERFDAVCSILYSQVYHVKSV